MITVLKKIYHKYSNTKLFQFIASIYQNGFFLSNYMSFLRMKRISSKQHNQEEPVKVVFLCQYVQAWNKLKSVYERMREDSRFETLIVAVPYDIHSIDNEVFEYFENLYGDNVVNAWSSDGWLDIESLNAHYIFYQRPYDQYLPKMYRSNVVSRYAKICHVVYGYQVAVTTENSCMNKLFFRNVYMYFAENTIYYHYNIDRFKRSHAKGYRKTLNIGYPSLEDFVNQKCEKDENDKAFKVLWTPRWSDDEEVGGSNFINFKDKIVELPKALDNLAVVFRPHPMTFQHFMSVGKITEQQVKDYLLRYEQDCKLTYDNKPDYAKVFWNCDVLLTDVSTIIAEWFLTGKPIIYCETGSKPNSFMKEMMKVFYIVNSWEEAERKVEELYRGIDPLKEEREKKVQELMGNDFEHISNRFLETIYEDYLN